MVSMPTPAVTSHRPDAEGSYCKEHWKAFECPWPSAKRSLWSELTVWPFERRKPVDGSVKPISVMKPSFSGSSKPETTGIGLFPRSNLGTPTTPSTRIQATWLGHASVLVQFHCDPAIEGAARYINILFDPMFSHRASPFSNIGPERHMPAPCRVDELPKIDIVCISHNHYDHLDLHTIAKLVKHDTFQSTKYFVPLGCKKSLLSAGVPSHQIKEKDWWDEETVSFAQDLSLKIVCTPAQHNSSRKLLDFNNTLWCSWVIQDIEGEKASPCQAKKCKKEISLRENISKQLIRTSRVFFGGDTGYRSFSDGPVCPAFKEIGERYGPFDLAFIPIWRGGVLSWLSKLGIRLKPEAWLRTGHCTPKDAIDVHRDLQARTSIAIHHSTFVGNDEAQWSVQLLKQACDESNEAQRGAGTVEFQRHSGESGDHHGGRVSDNGRFVVLDIGGSISL